eukprot:TRINITY_DN972_c1_g1_i1.p1 TRINITY_DN972_c1_g1~~TRINITY_DN972_c1_g1_i1.p1  ORF type:complete len:554 (-),score=91.42 TRINITY_DN972_c1_g1_i1:15-1445(-)
MLPYIKDRVEMEVQKNLEGLKRDLLGTEEERKKFKKFVTLPQSGLTEEEIERELDTYVSMAPHAFEDGKISGAVYNGDKKITQLVNSAMEKFTWSNPLHPKLFPGIRKMEAEIISMVVDMYNGTAIGACGSMTSGGTESILMSVRTHKEWAKAHKGITRPHMIVPVTAHAAFDKGADYFDVRITHIPVDPVTYKVNIKKVKQAICCNTIMIVGSCPNYPHGVQDDIEALSQLAVTHNIGLHVDCCLGGFIVPFMEAAGYPLPLFDFRVPGVTSISADPHKYGCAPKGSSVVLYRTLELRRFQFFCATNWPGGVYASPTMAGSRPGNIIAGCWSSMVKIGREGYINLTKLIVNKTEVMKEAVRSHKELFVFGSTPASVVALGSNVIDPYRVGGLLQTHGWEIGWVQFPNGIHISVTSLIDENAFVTDLSLVMKQIRTEPHAPPTTSAKTYGAATTMPDRSLIDRLSRGFLDTMYTPL